MIDWVLRAARLLQYASALGLMGVALAAGPNHWISASYLRRWLLYAAIAGVAGVAVWLVCESIQLAGTWTAWSTVLWQTRFGRVTALRAALLLLVLVTAAISHSSKRVKILIRALGGAAAASFAWSGHGTLGAGGFRWMHLGSDVLHLLAAGCWLGALAYLCIQAVCCRPQNAIEVAAFGRDLTSFSRIGPFIVALLIGTGMINSALLLGTHPITALIRDLYGRLLLAKLALFALMLWLAARNRMRLAPGLRAATRPASGDSAVVAALHRLRFNLLAEGLLGFLVLAAVAVLGTLAPPVSN